jgi:hypothetical protein
METRCLAADTDSPECQLRPAVSGLDEALVRVEGQRWAATSACAIAVSTSSFSATSSRARSWRQATFSGRVSSNAKLHGPTVACAGVEGALGVMLLLLERVIR